MQRTGVLKVPKHTCCRGGSGECCVHPQWVMDTILAENVFDSFCNCHIAVATIILLIFYSGTVLQLKMKGPGQESANQHFVYKWAVGSTKMLRARQKLWCKLYGRECYRCKEYGTLIWCNNSVWTQLSAVQDYATTAYIVMWENRAMFQINTAMWQQNNDMFYMLTMYQLIIFIRVL